MTKVRVPQPTVQRREKILDEIRMSFSLSVDDMRTIVRELSTEIARGLNGRTSSLKMMPSYAGKPTGREKGNYLALDLGGTNFRVLEVKLKGKGRVSTFKSDTFVLRKTQLKGGSGPFFDRLAECVQIFIKKNRIPSNKTISLGFTFSFPITQSSLDSGILVCWTKGFSVNGVIGRDVVELFYDALRRKGMVNIKIKGIINDTVGTLAAKAYSDRYCDIGVIIGTGTNACYYDTDSGMVINTEWGNFDKFKRTHYDVALDKGSENTGEQILEKAVSGMYLGEIVRLILIDIAGKGILSGLSGRTKLNVEYSLKTECLSEIESDTTYDLSSTADIMRRFGVRLASLDERKLVYEVCGIVTKRAARICASGIVGLVTKIDPLFRIRHTIAVDGSVYEKHPNFAYEVLYALRQLLGKDSRKVRMALTKDGSGAGAAIIAASAGRRNIR